MSCDEYLPLTMFSHQIWRSALNCARGKEKESKGDVNNQSNQSDSHLNCDRGSGKIDFKEKAIAKCIIAYNEKNNDLAAN